MANASLTSNKYAFEYVGTPASDDEKARTLANNGPLMIAQDHMWSAMMPEALDAAPVAHKKIIRIGAVHEVILENALYDPDLINGGTHFSLGVTRSAQFTKDIDEAGIDTTPVKGDWITAWPTVRSRIAAAIQALAPDYR